MMTVRVTVMAMLASLCSCGQPESDASGLSASEASALNDAAATLDAQMPANLTLDDPIDNAPEGASPTNAQ